MSRIKDFIKEYSHLSNVDSPFVYEDADGKRYKSVEDAYKSGKEVKVKNINDSALEDLKELGVESKNDANKLIELVSSLYGIEGSSKKSGGRTRKTYSDAEKSSLLEKWYNAEKQGVSKADFARQEELTYQTLIKWIKDDQG